MEKEEGLESRRVAGGAVVVVDGLVALCWVETEKAFASEWK